MHCTICHNATNNHRHTFREMMFGTREEFDYLECGSCGTIQIVTPPTNMRPHYPDNYYSLDAHPDQVYHNPLRAILERARTRYAVYGKTWNVIGNALFRRYPDGAPASLYYLESLKKDMKILDVGCGAGRLLYDLREIGFRNTYGTDPYLAEPIVYTSGLTIHNLPIEKLEGTFDLIMLHHVFEHIENPEAYLQTLQQKLTTTGTIIIRIPVANSEAWRIYGKNWVQLDPPRHFFLHTPMSMDILAARAGLVVEDIVFDSRDFQCWGSEQYAQDIPLMDERSLAVNPASTLFSREQRKEWKQKAQEYNATAQGDQACFYLKKQSNNS